jgi:hypothetical protein
LNFENVQPCLQSAGARCTVHGAGDNFERSFNSGLSHDFEIVESESGSVAEGVLSGQGFSLLQENFHIGVNATSEQFMTRRQFRLQGDDVVHITHFSQAAAVFNF